MDDLVRTKLSIEEGIPLFGTVIIDADLIIYLHINDKLLKSRCEMRKCDFLNAKNMQKKIEDELSNISTPVIRLEV